MSKISHHIYNDEPGGEDLEMRPDLLHELDTKTFYKATAQNLNDILEIN